MRRFMPVVRSRPEFSVSWFLPVVRSRSGSFALVPVVPWSHASFCVYFPVVRSMDPVCFVPVVRSRPDFRVSCILSAAPACMPRFLPVVRSRPEFCVRCGRWSFPVAALLVCRLPLFARTYVDLISLTEHCLRFM